MHGIGNEHDAQVILDWVRGWDTLYGKPECVEHGRAPEGWEFVGSGTYRSVWRSPGGVGYKVEHEDRYSSQSEEEAHNLGLAWSKGAPEGCRLPKFERYVIGGDETVIAIELIIGETLYEYGRSADIYPGDLYELLHECENRYRLEDLHDENVIIDGDGLLVPVDLGA